MKKKKGLIAFISFLILCVVALGVLVFVLNSKTVSDTDTVASVNGYDISAGELKLIMSTQKGYIIEEYGKGFSQIDDEFWNTKIGNTTPIEQLRKRALETLVRYKVEQQIAVKNGLISKEQTSFESFLDSLNKENQSRSIAVKNNQNAGVTSYTKSTYFEYVYGNMQIKNREALGAKGGDLYATDKQLLNWYESVKEYKYPKLDTYKFDLYRIGLASTTSDQATKVLENIKTDLESGNLQAIENYSSVEFLTIDVDDSNSSEIQKTYYSLYEQLETLQVGDVSEIMNENGYASLVVCKDRKEGGYKSFSTYKQAMYTEYIEQKYEEYVDEKLKKSVVKTEDKFKYVYLNK